MGGKRWRDGLGGEEGGLTNLSRKDLTALPSEKLIDIIAWQQSGMELVNEKLKRAEAQTRHYKGVVSRLSIDPATGVFTAGALAVMSDVLVNSRILEFLRSQSFTLNLCVLDVDEVKKHNTLGGREGGNVVLVEVLRRLRMLYRRRSDVVAQGLADFIGEPVEVLTGAAADPEHSADVGDEMIAWRFAPPTNNDARRTEWKVTSEAARVLQGFEDASVSYPLAPGIGEIDLKKLDPEGRFKVRSGIVTAPVTVTFACLSTSMPVDRAGIKRVMAKAAQIISQAKAKRKGQAPKASVGDGLNLTEDDINLS